MIILWFIFLQHAFIGFYDIWQMAKAEYPYWLAGGYNQPASDATSYGQFIFWYAEVLLSLAFVAPDLTTFAATLASIIFLHWCGLEDFMYYFFERWIQMPARYWQIHAGRNILGWRLPEELYWLARPREIGPITIQPYWLRMWAGDRIKALPFLGAVASGSFLIIALSLGLS